MIVVSILVLLGCFHYQIRAQYSQMSECLPEAEVKIQLAIYKIEQRQADKIARNELMRAAKEEQERKESEAASARYAALKV